MTITTGGLTWRRIPHLARKWGPQFAFDALLVALAYVTALGIRFEFDVPRAYRAAFSDYLPLAVLVHVVALLGFNVYREIWAHASVRQAARLALAFVTAAIVLYPLGAMFRPSMPLSVHLFAPLLGLMLVGGVRFRTRLATARRLPVEQRGLRVIVVGAGESGGSIIRETQRVRTSGLNPVAIVDDHPAKQNCSLLGVPVVGTIDDLGHAIARYRAAQVVLAIASADQTLVRRVARICDEYDVPLRLLPRVEELLGGRITLRDVRDLSIEDLIGRTPVDTDLAAVRAGLSGKRVLITGAGGSIGSEISRQVAQFDPSLLVLLDNDETHLHDIACLLPQATVDTVLADIRDADRISQIIDRIRPDFVFHAAAHKHVPILEAHPSEAYRTNVLGTLNVVQAARAAGVERFVLISTDKAVQPSSIMGASKRLAEQITLAHTNGGRFCAVRFGNVLGSRGSVIPTFARQMAAGGPLTVTDPNMTRFFISTPEAVQLVLQAAIIAKGGEIFMLDMGEATNIYELAKRMIRLSGRTLGADIDIQFTGVRPGEKLVEELAGPGEDAEETGHESLLRLRTPLMAPEALSDCLGHLALACAAHDDAEIATTLLRVTGASAAVRG